MLFISAQALPTTQCKNEQTGEVEIEPSTFKDATVTSINELGFKPMWAIPITTFKETMTSMILTAPNYPQEFVIFDTDDYVAVDKLSHYNNIMNDVTRTGSDAKISISNADIPIHRQEFCLNRETLPYMPLLWVDCTGSTLGLKDKTFSFNQSILHPRLDYFGPEPDLILNNYLNKLPMIDTQSIKEQMEAFNMDNPEIRATLDYSWYLFKYTILPILLYELCDDTKSGQMDLKHGSFSIRFEAIEACVRKIQTFLKLERDFAIWSKEDCSLEGFNYIYDSFKDLIIDDEEVLLTLFENRGKINRNDKCPCGSGKKFKKCHGYGMD